MMYPDDIQLPARYTPDRAALVEALKDLIPTQERAEFSDVFLTAIDDAAFKGNPLMVEAYTAAMSKAIEIWQQQDGMAS